jgi:competence protein ComEA
MIKNIVIGFLWGGLGLLPSVHAAPPQSAHVAPAIKTININTASAKALSESLPGIGPNKAVALVVYRKRFGDFKSVDDLAKVDGISAPTLQQLKPYIRLSDETESSTIKPNSIKRLMLW